MADHSGIEWTDATWNPVTGCTKVSPGCAHCYAERMTHRLHAMGLKNYANGFQLTMHEHALLLPLHWKKPKRVFVNSMSDLFHSSVSDQFIQRVFDVMTQAEQHVFQVLTKRSERLADLASSLQWSYNVWMGVSVETKDYFSRIDHLRNTPAAVKFLSLEPLLGPLHNLNLSGIDWVIVGCESGPYRRPCKIEWMESIVAQCKEAHVPVYVKQVSIGGLGVSHDPSEWPEALQVREYPQAEHYVVEYEYHAEEEETP